MHTGPVVYTTFISHNLLAVIIFKSLVKVGGWIVVLGGLLIFFVLKHGFLSKALFPHAVGMVFQNFLKSFFLCFTFSHMIFMYEKENSCIHGDLRALVCDPSKQFYQQLHADNGSLTRKQAVGISSP